MSHVQTWRGVQSEAQILGTRRALYSQPLPTVLQHDQKKDHLETFSRRLHAIDLLRIHSDLLTINYTTTIHKTLRSIDSRCQSRGRTNQIHHLSQPTDHNSSVDPSKASREKRQKNNKGTKREALTLSPFTLSIQGEYSTIHVKSNPKFNASPYVQTTTEIATSHHL